MTVAVLKTLPQDVEAFISEGFERHTMAQTGIKAGKGAPVTFVKYDGEKIVGALMCLIFYGQLHIKNLIVDENYRGRGIAQRLMDQAHLYGREHGCDFAFVETLSFQAPAFYKTQGYKAELERKGYAGGASFIYMKREL